jgi:hypothetical protein
MSKILMCEVEFIGHTAATSYQLRIEMKNIIEFILIWTIHIILMPFPSYAQLEKASDKFRYPGE